MKKKKKNKKSNRPLWNGYFPHITPTFKENQERIRKKYRKEEIE